MQKELYAVKQVFVACFRTQDLDSKEAGASSEDLRKLQQKRFQELLPFQKRTSSFCRVKLISASSIGGAVRAFDCSALSFLGGGSLLSGV